MQYLKVNKVNYIINKGSGPVFWEQRTSYAYESDLSYENAITTLLMVIARTKSLGDNFTFLLMDQSELDMLASGLEDIKNEFASRGYIWSFTYKLPTSSLKWKRTGLDTPRLI